MELHQANVDKMKLSKEKRELLEELALNQSVMEQARIEAERTSDELYELAVTWQELQEYGVQMLYEECATYNEEEFYKEIWKKNE